MDSDPRIGTLQGQRAVISGSYGPGSLAISFKAGLCTLPCNGRGHGNEQRCLDVVVGPDVISGTISGGCSLTLKRGVSVAAKSAMLP